MPSACGSQRPSAIGEPSGGFSAFIIALFTEMYGFPLTIYLLSGWLQKRFPGTDIWSHDFGHRWTDLIGWKGDPHLSPIHIASELFIVAGIWLLWSSWRVLLAAQKAGEPAKTGPYAHIRHPQYSALVLVMFGFLLQWPTIVTGLMFPTDDSLRAARHFRRTRQRRTIRHRIPEICRADTEVHSQARREQSSLQRCAPLGPGMIAAGGEYELAEQQLDLDCGICISGADDVQGTGTMREAMEVVRPAAPG